MPLSSHPQQPHNVSRILAGFQGNADNMAIAEVTGLPALHEILARIDHTSPPDPTVAAADQDDETGVKYTNLQPLDPKDLPTAILPLKAQMRKGLRELEKLQDIERSVEEQRDEIAELEAKIKRQEEVMRGMGKMGQAVRSRLGS